VAQTRRTTALGAASVDRVRVARRTLALRVCGAFLEVYGGAVLSLASGSAQHGYLLDEFSRAAPAHASGARRKSWGPVYRNGGKKKMGSVFTSWRLYTGSVSERSLSGLAARAAMDNVRCGRSLGSAVIGRTRVQLAHYFGMLGVSSSDREASSRRRQSHEPRCASPLAGLTYAYWANRFATIRGVGRPY